MMSTYQKDSSKFNQLAKSVSSGRSVIGRDTKQQSNIKSMVNLLSNEKSFMDAFNASKLESNMQQNATEKNQNFGIDALMFTNRQKVFMVNGTEHDFDDKDPIFSMSEP